MNQLRIRSGPKLEGVIKEHHQAFEQAVISTYFDAMEFSKLNLPAPLITDDLMFALNPKFHAATVLDSDAGQEGAFLESTKGLTEEEIIQFSANFLQDIMDVEYRFHQFDHLYHDDVAQVLDYHHMCYIDAIPNPFSMVPHYVFSNSPLKEVW